MNALELRGLTKHYKDFTLGPLDLTLPCLLYTSDTADEL